jgi:hypothetical protein
MFAVSKCQRVFERRLPGAGFVAIDVRPSSSFWRDPVFHGRVVVERRATSRGTDGDPPIVATASGASLEGVVQQLLPAAQCNETIGAALLRTGRRHPREALRTSTVNCVSKR